MIQDEINKTFDEEYAKHYIVKDSKYTFNVLPEQSEWSCYLFGNRTGGTGIVYTPNKGKEPNWFVRWRARGEQA